MTYCSVLSTYLRCIRCKIYCNAVAPKEYVKTPTIEAQVSYFWNMPKSFTNIYVEGICFVADLHCVWYILLSIFVVLWPELYLFQRYIFVFAPKTTVSTTPVLFDILLRCCLVAVYTHIMRFYLMFTLRCGQVNFFAIASSPLSLTPWLIIADVIVTGYKVITSAMKSMKIWNNALSPVSTTPVISYRQ